MTVYRLAPAPAPAAAAAPPPPPPPPPSPAPPPPSPAITRHHPPSPAITRHHPPSPAITRHHPPSPAITRHHPPSPAITRHHPPSPAITRHHPPSPAITRHHPPSPPPPPPPEAYTERGLMALSPPTFNPWRYVEACCIFPCSVVALCLLSTVRFGKGLAQVTLARLSFDYNYSLVANLSMLHGVFKNHVSLNPWNPQHAATNYNGYCIPVFPWSSRAHDDERIVAKTSQSPRCLFSGMCCDYQYIHACIMFVLILCLVVGICRLDQFDSHHVWKEISFASCSQKLPCENEGAQYLSRVAAFFVMIALWNLPYENSGVQYSLELWACFHVTLVSSGTQVRGSSCRQFRSASVWCFC